MPRAVLNAQEHSLLLRSLQCLLLVVYVALLYQHYLADEREAHARLGFQLATLSQNLEDAINSNQSLLVELDSYVQLEPDLDQERFSKITQEFFARQPSIRSLQLAKNSIISHVAPTSSHLNVIGYNVLNDPQVKDAISQQAPFVSGPLELIQGGIGLTVRAPIYLSPNGAGVQHYWGLATVLLDWNQVLRRGGLTSVVSEYDIALRQLPPGKAPAVMLYGPPELFEDSDSESITVHLLQERWELAIRSKLDNTDYLSLLALAIGAAFLLSTLYYLLRLGLSHKTRAPVAFFLSFILLSLLLIGFDRLQQSSQHQILLAQDLTEQHHLLRERLLNHQMQVQKLVILNNQQRLNPDLFEQHATVYHNTSPELLNIFWLDKTRRLQQSVGLNTALEAGEKLRQTHSLRAALFAQNKRQGIYSSVFEQTPGHFVFDFWQPLFRGDQFIGLIGARFDSQKLLEHNRIPELSTLYQLRLRNRSGTEFARLQHSDQPLSKSQGLIGITPPGQGLILELTRYQQPWPLLAWLLLGVLLTMGGIAAFSLQRVLRRYRHLRIDHDDQLKRNQQLMSEHGLLQVTLHAIGEGIITTDPNNLITRMNPEAERLCQTSTREACGQTLLSILRLQENVHSKPLREQLQQALEQVHEQKEAQRISGLLLSEHSELHNVRCTITPILDESEQHLGNVLVIHDLSNAQATARRMDYRDKSDQFAPLSADEFDLCCKEALIHAKETGFEHLLMYVDWHPEQTNKQVGNNDLMELTLLQQIKQQVRIQDPIARLSAERLALLLRYCPEDKGAELAKKMVQNIGENKQVQLHIGLVAVSDRCSDYHYVVSQADIACYIARTSGPNQFYLNPQEAGEAIADEQESYPKNGH